MTNNDDMCPDHTHTQNMKRKPSSTSNGLSNKKSKKEKEDYDHNEEVFQEKKKSKVQKGKKKQDDVSQPGVIVECEHEEKYHSFTENDVNKVPFSFCSFSSLLPLPFDDR